MLSKLSSKLRDWQSQNRSRTRFSIDSRDSMNANFIRVNGAPCINFSSNDYLGLANHPTIMEAFQKGVQEYGFGSGASSLVSGYFTEHEEVERKFAEWLNFDRAILFPSGYLANIGVMTALMDRHSVVLSDKYCHASILDGIHLSRAKHYRYRHNDISHLSYLFEKNNPDYIVTESVFSMEGTRTSIKNILDITRPSGRFGLIIDDAHGIGVMGKSGKGVCEEEGLSQEDLTCLIAPLGKAFNGMGAIVAGRDEVIEAILQFAGSYRYTTALPPAVCKALTSSLEIVKNDSWRRDRLKELISFFNENAKKRYLQILSSKTVFSEEMTTSKITNHFQMPIHSEINNFDLTPIRSIFIGNNSIAKNLQEKALSKGFFISCIRPPTVPENTARIRISLNSLHTEEQIMKLLDIIEENIMIIEKNSEEKIRKGS